MKGIVNTLPALVLACAAQAQIVIGSFDSSRSPVPFATATGVIGYDRLRASLTDAANFGPGGVVQTPVVIAEGTPALTAAYLADQDVFFTSVFDGALSATEATAIREFVDRGGCVIVEANSSISEQIAATSLLAALGVTTTLGPTTVCPNSVVGGTITSELGPITNGPFGRIAGGPFATSITAVVAPDARQTTLVRCPTGAARACFAPGAIRAGSGAVLVGGDPSGFGLFTDPGGSLFQPNNEVLYLNTIATCSCPEATWSNYGSGWPGSNGRIPGLALSADPVLGSELDLQIGNSLGTTTCACILIGLAPADKTTLFGGRLLVRIDGVVPFDLPAGPLFAFPLEMPTAPELCGGSIYLQTIEVDPGASNSVSFTPGLRLDIGG